MKKSLLFACVISGFAIVSCSKSSSVLESADLHSQGSTSNLNGEAGVLTAGEWNDLENWQFWTDLLSNNADLNSIESTWELYTQNRVPVRVLSPSEQPIINAEVSLYKDGIAIFKAHTDVQGYAELWADIHSPETIMDKSLFEIRVNGIKLFEGYNNDLNVLYFDNQAIYEDLVQVAFLVDATGSMGDEIEFLKLDLQDVIKRVSLKNPSSSIETGSVFYRDKNDSYLTKISGFTENINSTIDFINEQEAGGGGDYEEAMDLAIEDALSKLTWKSGSKSKIAFIFCDAPPHNAQENISSIQKSIKLAAQMGVKLIPIASSGVNKETEFLLRTFAIVTNGTYVFLTDDSGVGNDHIEATVGDYEVEFLNDLIVRLIHENMN